MSRTYLTALLRRVNRLAGFRGRDNAYLSGFDL